MQTSGRHIVSVLGTVVTVLLTVVLAAQAPQPADPEHQEPQPAAYVSDHR